MVPPVYFISCYSLNPALYGVPPKGQAPILSDKCNWSKIWQHSCWQARQKTTAVKRFATSIPGCIFFFLFCNSFVISSKLQHWLKHEPQWLPRKVSGLDYKTFHGRNHCRIVFATCGNGQEPTSTGVSAMLGFNFVTTIRLALARKWLKITAIRY